MRAPPKPPSFLDRVTKAQSEKHVGAPVPGGDPVLTAVFQMLRERLIQKSLPKKKEQ